MSSTPTNVRFVNQHNGVLTRSKTSRNVGDVVVRYDSEDVGSDDDVYKHYRRNNMSLYSQNDIDVTEERLPTLRQYVKSKEGKNIPKKFLVTLIWIPNKFPSYSIETEHFRASIGSKTAIGKLLKDNWVDLLDSDVATFMSVTVKDDKVAAMRFYPGTQRGMWCDIGSDPILGIRWENE